MPFVQEKSRTKQDAFISQLMKAVTRLRRSDRRSFFLTILASGGLVRSLALISPRKVNAAIQSPDQGTLEGVVRGFDSDMPIAGARVFLARTSAVRVRGEFLGPPTNLPATVADSLGRFFLANVAPGSYRLFATADGYMTHEYGQSPNGFAGIQVEVTAGGAVRDLSIWLNAPAIITGRILDPNRLPLPSVPVFAVSEHYDVEGRPTFRLGEPAWTNESGEYRLFGLPHGRYYVWAGIAQPFGDDFNVVLGQPSSPYATAYYPGFTEMSLATRIRVKPGDQISGIDFALPERVFRTIRGRILNSGRPVESAKLVITALPPLPPGTGGNRSSTEVYNPENGTFEYRELEPRMYRIATAAAEEETGYILAGEGLSVRAMVDLERSNVEDLLFQLPVEFGTISGRIRMEDSVPVAWSNFNVSLTPQDGAASRILFANADGILEANRIVGVPRVAEATVSAGYYTIDVNLELLQGRRYAESGAYLSDAYIKDVRLNGVSVLYQTFFIAPHFRGDIDIVVGRNGGNVQGVVQDDSGLPLSGALVALIPRPREGRTRFFMGTTSVQAGRFEFRGVAPGNYNVMAWAEGELRSYFDPEFLEAAESISPQISVREGDSVSVNVRTARLDE